MVAEVLAGWRQSGTVDLTVRQCIWYGKVACTARAALGADSPLPTRRLAAASVLAVWGQTKIILGSCGHVVDAARLRWFGVVARAVVILGAAGTVIWWWRDSCSVRLADFLLLMR